MIIEDSFNPTFDHQTQDPLLEEESNLNDTQNTANFHLHDANYVSSSNRLRKKSILKLS